MPHLGFAYAACFPHANPTHSQVWRTWLPSLLNWKWPWIFSAAGLHLRNCVFNSCGRGRYIWCWTGLVHYCLQSAVRVFMQLQNHFEYSILLSSPGDTTYSHGHFKWYLIINHIVTRYEQLIASHFGMAYVIKAQIRTWGHVIFSSVSISLTPISGKIFSADAVQKCLEIKHFKR